MDESNHSNNSWNTRTQLVHAGFDRRSYHGFINPPVVHASTVLYPDAATMGARSQKYTYGTKGTPTTDALCDLLASLDNAHGTVLVPSGLAATSLAFLSVLSAGDHMLVVDTAYSSTKKFIRIVLQPMGIEVDYYHPEQEELLPSLFKKNTKLVFVESPGSYTFELQNTAAVAKVAHAHGAVVVADNTWATPLLFKPLDHGVDISVQAATKYLSGHSDLVLGVVSSAATLWPRIYDVFTTMGICAGPDDVYLCLRGVRTLGVRLTHQAASARTLMEWLSEHARVSRVLCPASPTHSRHEIWRRDFAGSNGIFSVVLNGGGLNEAHRFLDSLQLFGLGYSWGGYESLAARADLSDRKVAQKEYEGEVIRLQIGLEDVEDLREDLAQALDCAFASV